jgi:hypothetical protein
MTLIELPERLYMEWRRQNARKKPNDALLPLWLDLPKHEQRMWREIAQIAEGWLNVAV